MQTAVEIVIPSTEKDPILGAVSSRANSPKLSLHRIRAASYLLADSVTVQTLEGNQWEGAKWEPHPPVVKIEGPLLEAAKEVGIEKSEAPQYPEKMPPGILRKAGFEGYRPARASNLSAQAVQGFSKIIQRPDIYPVLLGRGIDQLRNMLTDPDLDTQLTANAIRRVSIAHLGVSVIDHLLTDDGRKNLRQLKDELADNTEGFRNFLGSLIPQPEYDAHTYISDEEIVTIYLDRIAPQLQQLNKRYARNTPKEHLSNEWLGNPRPWVESVAAFILADIARLPLYQSVITIGTIATGHIIKSLWDSRKESIQLDHEPLTFLRKIVDFDSGK